MWIFRQYMFHVVALRHSSISCSISVSMQFERSPHRFARQADFERSFDGIEPQRPHPGSLVAVSRHLPAFIGGVVHVSCDAGHSLMHETAYTCTSLGPLSAGSGARVFVPECDSLCVLQKGGRFATTSACAELTVLT